MAKGADDDTFRPSQDAIRGANIQGSDGPDELVAKNGAYSRVNGGPGNDELKGGYWNAILTGGVGDDTIKSGVAGDFMYGGEGNDTLIARHLDQKGFNGKYQVDVLKGEGGDDRLINDGGFADMTGGKGRDVFEK